MPEARRARLVESYGLTPYDAQVLTAEKQIADYFDKAAKLTKTPKILANWIISELLRELTDANIPIDKSNVTPEFLAEMIELINNKTISGKIAKEVFKFVFKKIADKY